MSTLDLSGPDPPELLHVLLADPDEATRQMYGEPLRVAHVEVEEASDGREALAKALSGPHDLIVTETRLPGIGGYDLCQLLRRDLSTKATPIIVVTGDAYRPNVERARSCGADVVLVKPCLPDVLLAEMRRLCQRSAELRRYSQELRERSSSQVSRSQALQDRIASTKRRALSHRFSRQYTTTPPALPPDLVCPACDRALSYQRSHVGGVSERHPEQWDYYECAACGTFQFRQRTRKLRRVS